MICDKRGTTRGRKRADEKRTQSSSAFVMMTTRMSKAVARSSSAAMPSSMWPSASASRCVTTRSGAAAIHDDGQSVSS